MNSFNTLVLITVLTTWLLPALAAGQATPTIFSALDEAEARAEHHDRRAASLQDEIEQAEERLNLWSRDADTARRATGRLREEVAASTATWDRAFRTTETSERSWAPGAAADTRHLLAHAQPQALETRAADFALLRSVSAGSDHIEALFFHQGRLTVQRAQHRAEEETATKEREKILENAHTDTGRAAVERDLDQTNETLTDSLGELPKNPTTDDFHRLKGTLLPPVNALPAHTFGPRKQAGSMSFVRHTGYTYTVSNNTPVRAVASGLVAFAGRMEGYGNLVIIDHGSGYHSLYAHLDTLAVAVGDKLARHASLGRSGKSGSIEGPKLYFELRHQGRPIDPAPWFVQS
ncbi:MAG: murein hydrolase activator EnvC family protein [Bradymonadaceae bacterium]